MDTKRILKSNEGAVPLIIIIAICIGVFFGGTSAFIVYFATRTVSSILFGVAICMVFFMLVLPNIPHILNWYDKVKNSIEETGRKLRDERKKRNNLEQPKVSQTT